MPKAFWNGAMLAQSNLCRIVEGKYYFPPESIHFEFFRESTTHGDSKRNGVASFYHIEVDGELNRDAAWCFPDPNRVDAAIARYVAFSSGVDVIP
jgi:uncharacterized protein (DUF427 family)